MVELALDAGVALDRCRHVGLRTDPRKHAVSLRGISRCERSAMRTQRGSEPGRAAAHLRQTPFHQVIDTTLKLRLIVFGDVAGREHVLLERETPSFEDGSQRALLNIGGGEPLNKPAVDRLEPV
ncbi:MAG: hypothetical protein V9E83_07265 [Baekduia sp.]